jgi:hypothetical protein
MPDDTEVGGHPSHDAKSNSNAPNIDQCPPHYSTKNFFLIDCCYNLLSTKNFLVDYFATFVVFIDLFRLKGLSSAHNGK